MYIDGAARGNPGDAGVGVYIEKAGHPHRQEAYYIGEKTNNQAEYCALLVGLYLVMHMMESGEYVTIYTDSQLLAKQISGAYRVKKPWLKTLYQRAQHMLSTIGTYHIEHIDRENNVEADRLANYAIDAYTPLPESFQYVCS